MSEEKSLLAETIGDLLERPSKQVALDLINGKKLTCALWALTKREDLEAREKAYTWLEKSLRFSELYLAWDQSKALDEGVASEILAVALRRPENHIIPACKDASELRAYCSGQQIAFLWKEYLEWFKEQASFDQFEDVEMQLDEIVEHVKKNRPVDKLFSSFDSISLRELLHSAVARLATSPMDRSFNSPPSSD